MEYRKENVCCKGDSLTVSFLCKALTLALSLFVVLLPYTRSIYADDYDLEFENHEVPIWQWGAYRYWLANGYSIGSYRTVNSSISELLTFGDASINLDYIDSETPVTISVPSHYIQGSSNTPDRPSGQTLIACSLIHDEQQVGTYDWTNLAYCRLTENGYTETVNNLENVEFTISNLNANLTATLQTRFYTYLDFGSMGVGTYTGFSAYDSNTASTFSKGVTDLIFMIRPNVLSQANSNISVYTNSDATFTTTITNLGYYSGLTLFRIRVDTDKTFTGNLSIGRLVGLSETIYPIYFGLTTYIPDDLYNWLYGNRYVPILQQIDSDLNDFSTQNHEDLTQIDSDLNSLASYLQGGTSANQSAQNVNSSASSTDTATNQLHTVEQTQIDQFTTSLNSVPSSSSLLTTDGFLNGASYVRDMFDMVAVGQFRGLLSFTLIIGFALLMIGKVR